jgi:hypothetical protein
MRQFQLSQISAIMLGVTRSVTRISLLLRTLGLEVIMQEPQLALLRSGTVLLGLSLGHTRSAPHIAGTTEVVFQVEAVRATHSALAALGVPRRIGSLTSAIQTAIF